MPVLSVPATSPIFRKASEMPAIDRSLVAGLPIFAGCSGEDISDILRDVRSVRYPKNANVFEQGGKAEQFFLLLHGHIKAYKITPNGEEVVIRFIAPGEMFGVAIAIGRDAYPATASVIVDSVVLAWPNGAWPSIGAQSRARRQRDAHARRSPSGITHTRHGNVDGGGRAACRPRASMPRQSGGRL